MQIKVSHLNPTEIELSVEPTAEELNKIKSHVLTHFQDQVKVPGFRSGKTPPELVEKHADQRALQSRFLDEAVEQLYRQAVQAQNLRPMSAPKIELKKFVPFTALEFSAKFSVLGNIKLADYKKVRIAKPVVGVVEADVKEILANLQTRMSEKKDVSRAAKMGDQVWIDFSGKDTKGNPVKGADGKDYPLILGSKTFIPGFEDNIIGMKANDEKTFTLTFPKDYGVKALAGSKVEFSVSVTKVQEVLLPQLDNEFAKKAGPFKNLADLKEDIKKQIKIEREHQAQRDYESELVRQVTSKSNIEMPDSLIDEQVEHMGRQDRQNAIYRGLTWEEYLSRQDLDEEKYKAQVRPIAEERVKASIVLSEVADMEDINITKQELEARIADLKTQYKDPKMQEQLDSADGRNEVASKLLTEKAVAKLVEYASKK